MNCCLLILYSVYEKTFCWARGANARRAAPAGDDLKPAGCVIRNANHGTSQNQVSRSLPIAAHACLPMPLYGYLRRRAALFMMQIMLLFRNQYTRCLPIAAPRCICVPFSVGSAGEGDITAAKLCPLLPGCARNGFSGGFPRRRLHCCKPAPRASGNPPNI